jgi:hypothetical protein
MAEYALLNANPMPIRRAIHAAATTQTHDATQVDYL